MDEEIKEQPSKAPERPINKSVLWTLVFFGCIIILLIGSTLYFALETKTVMGTQNISANITAAFNTGVDATISNMLTVTNNCGIAALSYTNFTRQIVDVTCIPKLLADANMTITKK